MPFLIGSDGSCRADKVFRAWTENPQRVLTADFRRLSQIGIRTFHRRDAEYAEEIPFAQSGDDDWANTFSSNLRNVLLSSSPNKQKLTLCGKFLKGFLSVSICVSLWLIAFDALRLGASHLFSDSVIQNSTQNFKIPFLNIPLIFDRLPVLL
jgi:hypothetical protein